MRRLRVVTWNVGRIYTPSSNNRLADADVPRVARVLHELDPDVALLQEFVEARQLAALLARLPGYAGELSRTCRYDRHVAVLARGALDPAFEDVVLEPSGRGLLGVSVALGAHGRASAFSVHLDAFGARGRRGQAEAICDLVGRRAEPLTLIGGDFNLDPDFAAGSGAALDVGTWELFARRFSAAPPAGPTLMGLLRVDHLLARGPLVAHAETTLRGHVSPGRRLPMGDHDPVICDVCLPSPSRATPPGTPVGSPRITTVKVKGIE